MWTIGLLWYGISAGTEFIGSAFGWSEPLYRAWYLIGAFGVAAWLGLGTVFLLERTRFGYFVAFSVLGSFFARNEGVVVDTHVGRLTRRLGLTRHTDPVKVEQDLMKLVPVDEWTIFSHRLIWFGREVCTAKDPRCDRCELADLCPSAFKVGRWVKAPARRKTSPKRASASRNSSK